MAKSRLEAGRGNGHEKQHGAGRIFHQRQQDGESPRGKRGHGNP